ncbi:TonB-dependent receptor plug domain-containing protein [candidate division CSSED10-310 bacterium]|uniref:TonB-dependent receptor plug domain-containing protein n=1 Tax=candidate division CSSED10-310 bacterium TaxID=2855610 RepID=A0ABV6Z195_UNCC1
MSRVTEGRIMNVQLRTGVIVILFFIFSGIIVVSGQDQELDNLLNLNIEELMKVTVTTASRKPQKLHDVPATVRIITAQQIRERGYLTLEEVFSDLPGMQFRNILGFNSYVFMRGLPNQNNLILVMVDGVLINELNSGGFYGGGQFNLSNVRLIEIVYGPASALYGTNAISGIINIITNVPGNDLGGHISILAGSFNTANYDFRYNYFNADKKLGFNLSGMFKQTEKADLKNHEGDDNWTDSMENFEDDLSFDAKVNYKNFTAGIIFQDKQASRTTNYKTVGSDYQVTHYKIWFQMAHQVQQWLRQVAAGEQQVVFSFTSLLPKCYRHGRHHRLYYSIGG